MEYNLLTSISSTSDQSPAPHIKKEYFQKLSYLTFALVIIEGLIIFSLNAYHQTQLASLQMKMDIFQTNIHQLLSEVNLASNRTSIGLDQSSCTCIDEINQLNQSIQLLSTQESNLTSQVNSFASTLASDAINFNVQVGALNTKVSNIVANTSSAIVSLNSSINSEIASSFQYSLRLSNYSQVNFSSIPIEIASSNFSPMEGYAICSGILYIFNPNNLVFNASVDFSFNNQNGTFLDLDCFSDWCDIFIQQVIPLTNQTNTIGIYLSSEIPLTLTEPPFGESICYIFG